MNFKRGHTLHTPTVIPSPNCNSFTSLSAPIYLQVPTLLTTVLLIRERHCGLVHTQNTRRASFTLSACRFIFSKQHDDLKLYTSSHEEKHPGGDLDWSWLKELAHLAGMAVGEPMTPWSCTLKTWWIFGHALPLQHTVTDELEKKARVFLYTLCFPPLLVIVISQTTRRLLQHTPRLNNIHILKTSLNKTMNQLHTCTILSLSDQVFFVLQTIIQFLDIQSRAQSAYPSNREHILLIRENSLITSLI